jgi:hypothetical protein
MLALAENMLVGNASIEGILFLMRTLSLDRRDRTNNGQGSSVRSVVHVESNDCR